MNNHIKTIVALVILFLIIYLCVLFPEVKDVVITVVGWLFLIFAAYACVYVLIDEIFRP